MGQSVLLGEWVPASIGLIAVLTFAAVPVVSIGIYVVSRVLRADRTRRRLT